MRPALQALAAQQKQLEVQQKQLNSVTAWAKAQHEGTQRLARGLQALATYAGIEGQVAAAMLKAADVQNPAQPVPEPPAQPAPFSTVETKTPEAFADVNAPGLVPGSTNDVAADAVSTVYTPGQDVAVSPFRQLVDVTAPVAGTQGPQPLGDVKTETDVRVGDPMNPNTAFPLQGGFQQGQRTSARQAEDRSERMVASQRLARLQIQGGIVQAEDDLSLGAQIEKDASRTLVSINQEIGTIESMLKAAARNKPQRNPRLVPRTASGVRSAPSMQGAGRIVQTAGLGDPDDASDLFE